MTSKELVLNAIQRKETPRVPCICPGGMMNMIVGEIQDLCGIHWPEAHSDPQLMADLASEMYLRGILDNVGVPFCMTVEAQAMGAQVDLGDKFTEPRVSGYAASSVDELSKLRAIDLSQGRTDVVLKALSIIRDKKLDAAIVGNLTGPVSLASSLVDADRFYRDLRRKPAAAHALMDFVTDQLITFGLAQIKAGADIITIADPSGTGEILGPKLFETFALPYLNRITLALRPHCGGVILHICGHLEPVYSLLNQLAVDALSVDSCVNVEKVKQYIPDKAVIGNVSTIALDRGDLGVLQKNCNFCLAQGVSLLAPACGLGTRTSIASIGALMESSNGRANNSD